MNQRSREEKSRNEARTRKGTRVNVRDDGTSRRTKCSGTRLKMNRLSKMA